MQLLKRQLVMRVDGAAHPQAPQPLQLLALQGPSLLNRPQRAVEGADVRHNLALVAMARWNDGGAVRAAGQALLVEARAGALRHGHEALDFGRRGGGKKQKGMIGTR